MPTSSRASGDLLVLRPARSISLAVWWATLHGLLAVTAWLTAPSGGWAVALWVALGLHAYGRRPAVPEPIVLSGGRWSLPARGERGLQLGKGTRLTGAWVELDLRGGSRRRQVLVVRDQVDAAAWRRLQLAVRESARESARDPAA